MEILDRLRLGSSEKDIRAAFSDWTPLPPHPTQRAFGFVGLSQGRPAAVVCYFVSRLFSTKLGRAVINLFPERPTDAVAEDLHRQLKSELVARYGPFISDKGQDVQQAPPEYRMSAMTAWVSGDAVITLSLALIRHGVRPSAPAVAIGFGDRSLDPTAEMIAKGAQ